MKTFNNLVQNFSKGSNLCLEHTRIALLIVIPVTILYIAFMILIILLLMFDYLNNII